MSDDRRGGGGFRGGSGGGSERGGGGGFRPSGPREMHKATCADCKQENAHFVRINLDYIIL